MIQKINEVHIPACVQLIRHSFRTVADDFGFTQENAPGFTAFATTEERLRWHMQGEHRPMYAFFDGDTIIGYYSLQLEGNAHCELSNLCVHPSFRHQGIGEALLNHAFQTARELHYPALRIGIVEENRQLRSWYESFGFRHLGTKKFPHHPFTCGFMEKQL